MPSKQSGVDTRESPGERESRGKDAQSDLRHESGLSPLVKTPRPLFYSAKKACRGGICAIGEGMFYSTTSTTLPLRSLISVLRTVEPSPSLLEFKNLIYHIHH